VKYRAVIFDLFGTLVGSISSQEYERVVAGMASLLSAPVEDFVRSWNGIFDDIMRGALQDCIARVCGAFDLLPDDAQVEHFCQAISDVTDRGMRPREDAVDVLRRLRSAGYKTGLISDCASEVPSLWEGFALRPLIDAPVFSCSVGLKKPDPKIFRLAAGLLDVRPADCLYVADGMSDELEGAAAVGMSSVLIRVPGENDDLYRSIVESWDGPRVSSLTEVLSLLQSR
jgi:putative hydrolase of the HAD superfamily